MTIKCCWFRHLKNVVKTQKKLDLSVESRKHTRVRLRWRLRLCVLASAFELESSQCFLLQYNTLYAFAVAFEIALRCVASESNM